MAEKQITDRERASSAVASMLEQYAEQVRGGAEAALKPYLKRGETMPDVGMLSVLLRRMLDARISELTTASAAHQREIADDSAPREERDEARREVFDLVFTLRGTVEANFGRLGLRTLGLIEACPSTPQGTLTYARTLVVALNDKKAKLPKPRTKHVRFDREDLAFELDERVGRLDSALKAVAREEGEAKGTQSRKDGAMEAQDGAFRSVTNLAMGLFRLAGLGGIADRFRESSRRPGTLEVNEDTETTAIEGGEPS